MNTYEFTFLLNETDELKTLEDLFTSHKGEIVKKDEWGNKKLAYPIGKNLSANYYLWTLKLAPASVQKIRQALNFNTKLIRFLLLKVEA